jgi:nicotinamidase-related amidase
MITALLVIDLQMGIFRGERPVHDGEAVVQRAVGLIARARAAGAPVIYMQHDGDAGSRLAPGSDGWRLHPALAPGEGEPVIRKRAADSFHETTLQHELQRLGVERLVVAGCRTQFCVDTTCRRATILGYHVTLVGDAHTTTDSSFLRAPQIIAHHNDLLDDFGIDEHVVVVQMSSAVEFGTS